eukprot:g56821.t1
MICKLCMLAFVRTTQPNLPSTNNQATPQRTNKRTTQLLAKQTTFEPTKQLPQTKHASKKTASTTRNGHAETNNKHASKLTDLSKIQNCSQLANQATSTNQGLHKHVVTKAKAARGRSKEVKESHAMLGSKVTALCEVLLLDGTDLSKFDGAQRKGNRSDTPYHMGIQRRKR